MLLSYNFAALNELDSSSNESMRIRRPRALSSVLATLETLQPRALGLLIRVDFTDSLSKYYIDDQLPVNALYHTMPYRKWLHIHIVPRPNQEQTYWHTVLPAIIVHNYTHPCTPACLHTHGLFLHTSLRKPSVPRKHSPKIFNNGDLATHVPRTHWHRTWCLCPCMCKMMQSTWT